VPFISRLFLNGGFRLDVATTPITLSELPAGVIFDVLVVPGLEELSAILEKEPAVQEEEGREKEPFLIRLMARL
jgi:hypothetical protein